MLKYVLGIVLLGLSSKIVYEIGYRKGKKRGLCIGLMAPPTPSNTQTKKKVKSTKAKSKKMIVLPRSNRYQM